MKKYKILLIILICILLVVAAFRHVLYGPVACLRCDMGSYDILLEEREFIMASTVSVYYIQGLYKTEIGRIMADESFGLLQRGHCEVDRENGQVTVYVAGKEAVCALPEQWKSLTVNGLIVLAAVLVAVGAGVVYRHRKSATYS